MLPRNLTLSMKWVTLSEICQTSSLSANVAHFVCDSVRKRWQKRLDNVTHLPG
jgi:hypothetical protein